ncbi:hypothetical protein [Methylobacterium sp. NEAU K]|uniref:hypothetical protein n=1 Tax=Methylobacterium sp. NEAU K TaxID=3064946 RepID=UPI002734C005|nr:hypothetical protein [Methylobacterium sp. NEAU K]MDP4006270.1 hypothetical protein [Methylobacterium sp. NEAU K]
MTARVDPGSHIVSVGRAPFKTGAAVLVLVATIGAPAAAWAWGVPGCTNLPEYNRALGALQGMTSACDMTVEEARRVVAAHDGVPVVEQPAAPAPRLQDRRHRVRSDHVPKPRRRPPRPDGRRSPAR